MFRSRPYQKPAAELFILFILYYGKEVVLKPWKPLSDSFLAPLRLQTWTPPHLSACPSRCQACVQFIPSIFFAHSTFLAFLTHPWSRARFQAPWSHPPLGFLPGLCSEKLLQTRIQSWGSTTWEHPQACLCSRVPLFLLRQTSQTLWPLPLSAGPVRWLFLIKHDILSKLTLRLRAFEAVLTIVSLCLTASLVKDETSPSPC